MMVCLPFWTSLFTILWNNYTHALIIHMTGEQFLLPDIVHCVVIVSCWTDKKVGKN